MTKAAAVLMIADLGDDAGLGHLARSSSLAAALTDRGLVVEAIGYEASTVAERDGVGWRPESSAAGVAAAAGRHPVTVLDSYRLPAAAADEIAAASRLVLMLDHGDAHPDAALVVAPSDFAPSSGGRLNGLEHALLGRRYSELPAREPAERAETVLVTTGGGDPGGRAAALAQAARRALPAARVLLVRGPRAQAATVEGVETIGPLPDLAEVFQAADLVVCGAGGTMVEACAAGVPAAVTILAPNQKPIARALERANAVVLLDEADPEATIAALGGDQPRRAALARAARTAVDGRGAERVAAAIERLLG